MADETTRENRWESEELGKIMDLLLKLEEQTREIEGTAHIRLIDTVNELRSRIVEALSK